MSDARYAAFHVLTSSFVAPFAALRSVSAMRGADGTRAGKCNNLASLAGGSAAGLYYLARSSGNPGVDRLDFCFEQR